MWTDDLIDEVHGTGYGRCHLCGGRTHRDYYGVLGHDLAFELDHVDPVSFGGSDDVSKGAQGGGWCNRSRGNMPVADFRRLTDYSPGREAAGAAMTAAGVALVVTGAHGGVRTPLQQLALGAALVFAGLATLA